MFLVVFYRSLLCCLPVCLDVIGPLPDSSWLTTLPSAMAFASQQVPWPLFVDVVVSQGFKTTAGRPPTKCQREGGLFSFSSLSIYGSHGSNHTRGVAFQTFHHLGRGVRMRSASAHIYPLE